MAVTSIAKHLSRHAQTIARKRAFLFLVDGREHAMFTYAELDDAARRVAAAIARRLERGARALLIHPPGPEFVVDWFACLYAGVIAVPAPPPDPQRLASGIQQLSAIARDCDPTAILTTRDVADWGAAIVPRESPLAAIPWLALSTADDDGTRVEPVAISETDVAFLQYTSGSTGAPKGVVVSHGNITANLEVLRRSMRLGDDTIAVNWLPHYHDMGLIGATLCPIGLGASAIMMSPFDFLKRPAVWLEAITRHHGTASAAPNFGYEICTRRIGDEELARLDLRSWRIALNGADVVRAATLERFVRKFGRCGFAPETFQPCYGLAESTLYVSGIDVDAAPATCTVSAEALERGEILVLAAGAAGGRTLVSCGRPGADHRVLIVDPVTCRTCPAGTVGEIWTAGSSVTLGYWRGSDEANRAFAGRLADGGEGPFLRTGDLGFIEDGALFVVGRMKDAMKIAGRNIYPQDVESAVETRHPAIRAGGCAVFSVDDGDVESMVMVVEADTRSQPATTSLVAEIERAVRAAVGEAVGLPVRHIAVVARGQIPKTSSGKIRRAACRALWQAGGFEMVAPDAA